MPRIATDPRVTVFSITEIWRNARLVWRLMTDRRVPFGPKAIIPVALIYLISPVDLIPDVLPGLGQLDDLAILLLGVKLFIEMCPSYIVQEHLSFLRFGKQGSGGRNDSRADSTHSTIEGMYRVVDDEVGQH